MALINNSKNSVWDVELTDGTTTFGFDFEGNRAKIYELQQNRTGQESWVFIGRAKALRTYVNELWSQAVDCSCNDFE